MSKLSLRASLKLDPSSLTKRDIASCASHQRQVVQAWCAAVARLTPLELQEQGKELLALWQALTGASDFSHCDAEAPSVSGYTRLVSARAASASNLDDEA